MDEKPPTSEVVPVDDGESRPLQAYRMKLAGRPLAEIAEELGYGSPSAVANAITTETKRQIAMVSSEDRESLLQLQNDRYEYLLSKVWPSVEHGDLGSIEMARKLIGDLTKLHQLDALDTSSKTMQVLVVGGAEADYVESLKKMVEG